MYTMKLFVLLSFIATTLAEQPGYNYQQPEFVGGVNPYTAYMIAQSYVPPAATQFTTNYQPQVQSHQEYVPPVSESYNKEFYTFSAPEEEFQDPYAAQRIAAAIQRNLRVIFIKSPENRGVEHAALQLAKHASDDRTAIYVLNKQADIGELASKLNNVRDQHAHKPEVHFVKYRTPEEAAHAQQYIQSQYDQLQGPSHNSNEGVARVINFASRPQTQSQVSQVSSLYAAPHVSGSAISIVPGYAGGGGGGGAGGYYGQIGSASIGGNNINTVAAYNTGGGDGDLSGITDNAVYAAYAENTVSKINSQLSAGSGFSFPAGTNTYIPPLKRN